MPMKERGWLVMGKLLGQLMSLPRFGAGNALRTSSMLTERVLKSSVMAGKILVTVFERLGAVDLIAIAPMKGET
jgi:hypothetical protein